MIEGRNVLLTGGCGSVGRHLIPKFLEQDPHVLRIFDNSETGLARLQADIDDDRCRYLAGDIRDKSRLDRAMENIDIVVHSAAMKHVDVCEYNPFEAVKTNVMGLQNVVDAAIDNGVKRLIFTSSDKAVNPANTMGTTKLLGEKLVTAGNKYKGEETIRLGSVRFGNIVNSSRSVIPIFTEQIKSGGPITLTDERMTRFFLTYSDVFDLITQALEHVRGGEVFVYKMPAIRIADLAEAMTEVLAPRAGYNPSEIEIEITGRRPGETFHEEIMTRRESGLAYENDTLFSIPTETENDLERNGDFTTAEDLHLSSADAPKLDTDEIVTLLEENGALGGNHV